MRFKKIFWAVAAFTTCYTIAGTDVVIFQCRPIVDWDPRVERDCVVIDAELIAIGVINPSTDFLILSLPVPYIWQLYSSRAQKLQLMGIFLLGGL